MFGSSFGTSFGGSTIQTRTLVIRVPVTDTIVEALAPQVSSGKSLSIPVADTVVEAFAPTIRFTINVPVAGTVVEALPPDIVGGASVLIPVADTAVEAFPPELVFIVPGIPSFIAERDGTTVDLTFSGRDGKEVAVWRADEFNLNSEEIDTVDADTYQDTVTATLNYKYQIQFVSTVGGVVTARGRKTGSKLTKA